MAGSENQHTICLTLSNAVYDELLAAAEMNGISKSAYVSTLVMQQRSQRQALNSMEQVQDLLDRLTALQSSINAGQLTI